LHSSQKSEGDIKVSLTPNKQIKNSWERLASQVEGGFDFSFAFQPIVDALTKQVVSFEALVRGPHGEPSSEIFAKLDNCNRYCFDQACRVKAIYMASQLKLHHNLNINLFPNAVYQAGMSLKTTLEASLEYGFPTSKIIFEVTEDERVTHPGRLIQVIKTYNELGFQTAIDDFGVGYSGLYLLQEYQPDYIKLDRRLISDIHSNSVKQTIVKGIIYICQELNIEIMAEGVESVYEYEWLFAAGIHFFQGYYFARPAFEYLPEVMANRYCV
jgi:EAL domain-containing protein (putative c-di-GMP-specific phosphodiesterase class I)